MAFAFLLSPWLFCQCYSAEPLFENHSSEDFLVFLVIFPLVLFHVHLFHHCILIICQDFKITGDTTFEEEKIFHKELTVECQEWFMHCLKSMSRMMIEVERGLEDDTSKT